MLFCASAITMRRTYPDYPIGPRIMRGVWSRAEFSRASWPSPVDL